MLTAILKNKILWYMASRYATFAVQFVAGIFVATRLSPFYFGIWGFISLLVAVASNFHWGIGNSVTILLVQHKEDKRLCDQYVFNSLLLIAAASLLPVICLGYEQVFGVDLFEKYQLNNFIYAVVILTILNYINGFFRNIFRVKNKIIEIIIQQSLWPLLMLLLFCFASGKLLLNLLVWGWCISGIISLTVFISRGGIKYKGCHVDFDIVRQIISKGFFLFLYNAGFTFIMMSTKSGISYFYTVEEFGYFVFGFSLASGALDVVASILFLIFPKTIDMLKGNDVEKIRSGIFLLRSNYLTIIYLLFYTVVAFSGSFFDFIPQYKNSFLPFLLVFFTLIMYTTCFGYDTYLLAQNKERQFCLIVGGALLFNIVIVILCGKILHLSFCYTVLATLLTYFLYSITVNAYSLVMLGERSIKVFMRELLPWRSMILYWGALFIVMFYRNSWVLFIPLMLFIILNYRSIVGVVKTALSLLKNDKLINV